MHEKYCERCGDCCMHAEGIPVTKSDIKRWESNGRKDITEKLKKYNSDFIIPTNKDLYCIFLEQESENKTRCSIYKDRPEVCRAFPLTLSGTLFVYPERCKVAAELKKMESLFL